jgi:hypothetical protein
MGTKIWTANIFIGELDNPHVLELMVTKKLPTHILLSDSDFVDKLIKYTGEKKWVELKVNKKTRLPQVKIHFVKQIGTVNQEPIIENYETINI